MGKFGITPTKDADYSINFHYVNRDKVNPPSIDSVKVFTSTPAFSHFFRYPFYDDWGIDLNAEQKLTSWMTCKAKLFYHNHVDELQSYSDETFMKAIALSNYQDYIVGGTLITEFKPVAWNAIRLSFNYKGDSHKQRDDLNYPFENFFSFTGSAGIEDEVTLSKNFSIVVGGSYRSPTPTGT